MEALIKLGLFSLHLSPLGAGFFPTTCLFIHNCIKTAEPSGVWLQTCEVSAAFRALMQSHALQHPTGHEGGGGGGSLRRDGGANSPTTGPETSFTRWEARTRARIRFSRNSRGPELFYATKEQISPVKGAYKSGPRSTAFLGRSNAPVKETIPPSKQLSSSLFHCQPPLHFMFIFPICFVL